MIKNIYLLFCHIAALSGGIYMTYELLKKLEQCNQQTDMIMFHMLWLRNCYNWAVDMGMILVIYGVTLLFDVMTSDCIMRCAILKKISMIAIIGGGIIVVIAKVAVNYITGLGF